MDSPGGAHLGDASPSRALAGPQRSRRETRQRRATLSKPYGRPSLGAAPSSAVDGDGAMASPAAASQLARQRQLAAQTSALADGSDAAGSPVSSLKRKSSVASISPRAPKGGGLFSTLREAIFSRPLSWLNRGAPQPSSLPTTNTPGGPTSATQQVDNGGPASSLRASASITAPGTSRSRAAAPSSATATWTPLSRAPSAPTPRQGQVFNVGLGHSQLATPSWGPARSSASRPRSPSPARSSASAAIAAQGRQRMSVEPSGLTTMHHSSALLSTPGYRRSASRTPAASIGHESRAESLAAQSSASFAYGFGSERRLAGINHLASTPVAPSPSRLAASTSYGRLPSRSPFAMSSAMVRSSMGGSEASQSLRSPLRPATVYGGEEYRSRAGSVAGSASSSRAGTPRKREWSSLKLAPPNTRPSEGDRLMQEYMAMCQGQGEDASHASALPPSLVDKDFSHMSAHGGLDPLMDIEARSQIGSLKRGVSMSVDGDEAVRSEAASRKRQMLWDPEMGFVSRQELRAAQPSKPRAQNEAERLLNALEGLKSPQEKSKGGSRASGTTPSRSMMTVPVPLHVSSRSDADSDLASQRSRTKHLAKSMSPYSRSVRQTRLARSNEPESMGLRSRLKPHEGSSLSKRAKELDEDAMSVGSSRGEADEANSGSGESSEALSDDNDRDDAMQANDEDDDDIIEPPRRKLASTTKKSPAKAHQEVPQENPSEGRTLRSGKILPQSVPKHQPHSIPQKNSVKPMSRARISISANGASAASLRERTEPKDSAPQVKAHVPAAKDTFVVGGGNEGGRMRSSLRQGAEKSSRSHVKSGRVGLDDDGDDDDDVDAPSTEELEKIKLPSNLFPSGFSFASAPSSMSAAKPVGAVSSKEKGDDDGGADPNGTSAGSSLLNRLGGFAPAPAPAEQVAKDNASVSSTALSLGAPSATSSTSDTRASAGTGPLPKPVFSFQPTVSSPLAAAPSSESSSTTSDFFAVPPQKTDTGSNESFGNKKNDGPVPNFFASSISKSTEEAPAEGKKKDESRPAPFPGFNFSKPDAAQSSDTSKISSVSSASTPAPAFSFSKPESDSKTSEQAPKPPTFSFGNSLASEQTTKVPTFSFGSSATAGEKENKSQDAAAAPATSPFSFGQTTSKPSGSFSFGGFQGTSSPEKKELEVSNDANQDNAIRKDNSAPSSFGSASKPEGFSFGASSTAASTTGTPAFGGFNQASPATSGEPSKKRGMEEAEASKGEDVAQKKGPTFSFGTPAAPSPGGFSFGSSKVGEGANKTAFSFGASSAPQPSSSPAMPSFGKVDESSSSATQSTPSFSFGAQKNSALPVESSNVSATTNQPTPSFAFGASKPNGAQTSTGFSFGAPSNSSTSVPAFGQAAQPAQPSSGLALGSSGNTNTGSFGTSAFGSQDSSRQASPAPFTFGAPQVQQPQSTTSGATGFGGFGQSQQAQSGQSSAPFTFGAPAHQQQSQQAPAQGNNSPFTFGMPMGTQQNSGASSGGFGSANGGGSNAPFVFGAPSANNTTTVNNFGGAPMSNAPGTGSGSGFTFGSPAGSPAPGANDMSGGGGGNLFNIGAPSTSSPAGNRVVRGMPARRRKA